MSSPCFGCVDRVMLCHSTCERYKSYKREGEKANEIKKAYNDVKHVVCTQGQRTVANSKRVSSANYRRRKTL